jgi:hypothetical protein
MGVANYSTKSAFEYKTITLGSVLTAIINVMREVL